MTRLGKGKDGRVLEREFDATIFAYADRYGWLCSHTTDSRRDVGHPGRPDWLFVHTRTGEILFVETKVEGGKISDNQVRWMDSINHLGDDDAVACVTIILPKGLDTLRGLLRG